MIRSLCLQPWKTACSNSRTYSNVLNPGSTGGRYCRTGNVSAAQLEEIYQRLPTAHQETCRVGGHKGCHQTDAGPRRPDEDAAAFLLERTRLFAASPDGNKGNYTPYPENWFSKERYLDNEQEWYATENRSGSLKREAVEQDETPGESLQDVVQRLTKKQEK